MDDLDPPALHKWAHQVGDYLFGKVPHDRTTARGSHLPLSNINELILVKPPLPMPALINCPGVIRSIWVCRGFGRIPSGGIYPCKTKNCISTFSAFVLPGR
jgi:hypothetical protein